MNDKTGFDLIDAAFQEDLEKARQAETAKLRQEIQEGKHPNFSQSHTDWMLAKFPYANQEQSDKAVAAEDEKRRRQQEAFDAEVEMRLGEQQAILEQLHFGKQGRQFALEQAEREEKIEAFKQRQREKREQEKDKSAEVEAQPDSSAENQEGGETGNTTSESKLKDDFNMSSSEAEYDEWQIQSLEKKEEAFKQRLREDFNAKRQEKSTDMEAEM